VSTVVIWGWLLFAIYFVFMCYMSWRGERATKGLNDYLVAPRSYGPLVVALALGATTCSAAATMGNPGLVYRFGWPGLWYGMGYGGIIAAWALTAFKLSKVGAKVGSKSMADFMGIRFQSDFMRGITAVITLLMVYYIGGQFAGVGWVFQTILNVPYSTGVIAASIIITIYVIVGGTHADVLNCAIQGTIMMIVSVIVGVTVLTKVGSLSAINDILTAQSPALSWNTVFANPNFGQFTGPGIMISLSLFALTPQLSKLWFALKSDKEIPKTLWYGFIFMMGMGVLMWLGGLGARAVLPEATSDTATLQMLIKFLPAPLSALAGVGILSAIMSTLAGLFLVVAIAVVNDLWRDIIVPRFYKDMPAEKADAITLKWTRILIPIIMLIGLIIAFNPPKLLTALMWVGIGAFAGGLSPVMILGCSWRGITKAGAITGSVLGFGSYLVCYFIIGKGMGVPMFQVPWFGSTVAIIVGFISIYVVSKVTKPFSNEHLDSIFGEQM